MNKFRVAISVVIIFIIAFSALHLFTNKKDNVYAVTETYIIQIAQDKTGYLSVDLPITYGYQSISGIEVMNVDEYSFRQKDDCQTLKTHFTGNGEERVITINYSISLSKGKVKWTTDVNEQHLRPSEVIDSDNAKIIEVARSLLAENDDLKTVKNISEYVSRTIGFDRSTKVNQDTLSASEVLTGRKGNCGDYANLMTALLRAVDIPSKSISGLALDRLSNSSDWSSPAASHAWVEFYVDGDWYFDDPSWGNKHFTNSDGYHLSYGATSGDVRPQIHDGIIEELKNEGFHIMGAMTAPIRFMAWSNDDNSTITPRVIITRR